MQNSYQRPSGFNILPIGIKNLIIINVLLFLACLTPGIREYLLTYLPLWYFELPPNFPDFIPTQLLTYQFLHSTAGFGHLFFNMFALWMFGSIVENYWGVKKFIFFYLISGIGAGLFHLLYTWVIIHFFPDANVGIAASMVGASGAVYGVTIAYAFMFPNNIINLYFVIPIKAKYFAMGILAIDFVYGLVGNDGVAHFAHIGGAITGLLILLVWKTQGKLFEKFR